MTWHLKDRELEKKLIAIDCEFLDNLNDAVNEKIEEFSPGRIEEGDLITLMFCRDHQIELGELYFLFHELEEVPEYNPHAWNEYPKVKPPYNVMMRVETHTGQGYKLFYNHLGDGDFWSDPNYLLMPKAFSDDVTRFRPWSED